MSTVTSSHGLTYRCSSSHSTFPYLLPHLSDPLELTVSDEGPLSPGESGKVINEGVKGVLHRGGPTHERVGETGPPTSGPHPKSPQRQSKEVGRRSGPRRKKGTGPSLPPGIPISQPEPWVPGPHWTLSYREMRPSYGHLLCMAPYAPLKALCTQCYLRIRGMCRAPQITGILAGYV